jgi:hypothetical protein
LSIQSELLKPLENAGYKIEKCFGSEDTTVVVEIPIDVGEGIRTAKELCIWEQVSLAAFLQKYWADNAVSCTVTFDPKQEGKDVVNALNYFQYSLKDISFLPRHNIGAYKQMPYEAIDKNRYNKEISSIKRLTFGTIEGEEAQIEKFCDGDTCLV